MERRLPPSVVVQPLAAVWWSLPWQSTSSHGVAWVKHAADPACRDRRRSCVSWRSKSSAGQPRRRSLRNDQRTCVVRPLQVAMPAAAAVPMEGQLLVPPPPRHSQWRNEAAALDGPTLPGNGCVVVTDEGHTVHPLHVYTHSRTNASSSSVQHAVTVVVDVAFVM